MDVEPAEGVGKVVARSDLASSANFGAEVSSSSAANKVDDVEANTLGATAGAKDQTRGPPAANQESSSVSLAEGRGDNGITGTRLAQEQCMMHVIRLRQIENLSKTDIAEAIARVPGKETYPLAQAVLLSLPVDDMEKECRKLSKAAAVAAWEEMEKINPSHPIPKPTANTFAAPDYRQHS